VLLKRGHHLNAGAKGYEGRIPFQLASMEGHKATVKLLLEYGAKGVLYILLVLVVYVYCGNSSNMHLVL
jgi:ankyrin repeat protein